MQCNVFQDQEKNTAVLNNKILSLGKYHPFYRGNNPNFDEFSKRVYDLKRDNLHEDNIIHFTNELLSLLSDNEIYVICVIPKHTIGTPPSGIRTIAERLCHPPIIDGTNIIVRSKEINKKSAGGSRDLELEIESLSLKNEIIVKDQQVLLLDDVTTSGASLRAGKYLLEEAGAKLVAMYAMGRTQFI